MRAQLCTNFIISRPLKLSPIVSKPQIVHYPFSVFLFCARVDQECTHKITVFDYLVNQHQFSPESALKASSLATNKYIRSSEESDLVLFFLRERGFTKTQIENMVRRNPRFLFCNLERTIKPKIQALQDLGFRRTDIVAIICRDPWILWRSVDYIERSILALRSVFGSIPEVANLLRYWSLYMKFDLEKTFVPNIEFLMDCGVSFSRIVKFMHNYSPRIFLNTPEMTFKDCVRRVDALGFDRKSKLFLHAILAVNSMSRENWELKLEVWRQLGFSEEDILSIFRRTPQVFIVSDQKTKDIMELLLGEGNLTISDLVTYPLLLTYSLEKRLKPRLRIFRFLESKNLVKASFASFCKMSNKQFLCKYIQPNLDVLEDWHLEGLDFDPYN